MLAPVVMLVQLAFPVLVAMLVPLAILPPVGMLVLEVMLLPPMLVLAKTAPVTVQVAASPWAQEANLEWMKPALVQEASWEELQRLSRSSQPDAPKPRHGLCAVSHLLQQHAEAAHITPDKDR